MTEARSEDRTPIVRVQDLVVRFGGVSALRGVTLDFYGDEVCGLIGPNGAGKTTLFDTVSGLQPATEGTIQLDGKDVTTRSSTWRARHGMRRTFQRQQVFGGLSVEDNVLTALEWRGGGGGVLADLFLPMPRRAKENVRRQRVDDVLELCGLTGMRSVPVGQLSIGKARMVEMARAIADRPRVLLLDEPTSGLEEWEVHNFGETMQRVRQEESCAVVLVEHDIDFVMRECHRIAVLGLGEIIALGTPEEIRVHPEVVNAYLG